MPLSSVDMEDTVSYQLQMRVRFSTYRKFLQNQGLKNSWISCISCAVKSIKPGILESAGSSLRPTAHKIDPHPNNQPAIIAQTWHPITRYHKSSYDAQRQVSPKDDMNLFWNVSCMTSAAAGDTEQKIPSRRAFKISHNIANEEGKKNGYDSSFASHLNQPLVCNS